MNDKKVWDAIQNGTVINIFQFDSEVGSQAAKKIKPTTILELTDANGLMRLMTAEKVQKHQWKNIFVLKIILIFGIKKWIP